jgi:hypothetical protein
MIFSMLLRTRMLWALTFYLVKFLGVGSHSHQPFLSVLESQGMGFQNSPHRRGWRDQYGHAVTRREYFGLPLNPQESAERLTRPAPGGLTYKRDIDALWGSLELIIIELL